MHVQKAKFQRNVSPECCHYVCNEGLLSFNTCGASTKKIALQRATKSTLENAPFPTKPFIKTSRGESGITKLTLGLTISV